MKIEFVGLTLAVILVMSAAFYGKYEDKQTMNRLNTEITELRLELEQAKSKPPRTITKTKVKWRVAKCRTVKQPTKYYWMGD